MDPSQDLCFPSPLKAQPSAAAHPAAAPTAPSPSPVVLVETGQLRAEKKVLRVHATVKQRNVLTKDGIEPQTTREH